MSALAAIVKELQSSRDAIAKDIVAGQAVDHAAYRYQCGQVKAYDRAIAVVRDTAAKYEETEFEDPI